MNINQTVNSIYKHYIVSPEFMLEAHGVRVCESGEKKLKNVCVCVPHLSLQHVSS